MRARVGEARLICQDECVIDGLDAQRFHDLGIHEVQGLVCD